MFDDLKAPFPVDAIHWRVGATNKDKTKGIALAYLNARDVMERLDAVCGYDGWQCCYSHVNDGKTVCDIGIRSPIVHLDESGQVHEKWIWKADGAGDTQYEAEKGALSDAFKRAAVRWGIGRYLYGLPNVWVAVENEGRRIVPDEIPKLMNGLGKHMRRTFGLRLNKTGCKKQLTDFVNHMKECTTLDAFNNLEAGYEIVLKEAEIWVPEWMTPQWDSDRPSIPEEIEAKRDELGMQENTVLAGG